MHRNPTSSTQEPLTPQGLAGGGGEFDAAHAVELETMGGAVPSERSERSERYGDAEEGAAAVGAGRDSWRNLAAFWLIGVFK